MPLVTRFFSFDDLSPDQAWGLLEWCRLHEADAFTISALVTGSESSAMHSLFQELKPDELPPAPRRLLTAPSREQFVREVPLWRLSDRTVGLLRQAMPNGFATREYVVDLWLEDITVYRATEFMMGVLSHENGGVLRVTELELQELHATGFPDRDEVAWVGF